MRSNASTVASDAPSPVPPGGPRIVKASHVQLRVRREDPAVSAVDVETLVAAAVEAAATEAYRVGYEDGFGAGALQAGATLADAIERLHGTVAVELAKLQAAVAVRREDEAIRLVDLAFVVAEWAARRELCSVPEAFFDRLEELLADRERRAPVEIAVHPELLRATRAWAPDPELRVIGTDELEPGECRVTIGDGTVFATFTDAFSRARDALGVLPPLEVSAPGVRAVASSTAAAHTRTDHARAENRRADHAHANHGLDHLDAAHDALHAAQDRLLDDGVLGDGVLDDEVVEVLYDADPTDDAGDAHATGGAW